MCEGCTQVPYRFKTAASCLLAAVLLKSIEFCNSFPQIARWSGSCYDKANNCGANAANENLPGGCAQERRTICLVLM